MAKKSSDKDLQNLPANAAEFMKLVIKKMRYRKKIRADVQAELVTHFEDELRDCSTNEQKDQKASQLIKDFGDIKLLARLLRRAKKRCRPLWRTIGVRTFQAAGILIVCLVIYIAWFFTGKPVITTNYLDQLNNIVRPVADESLNAAPIYEKAFKIYDEIPEEIKTVLGKRYNDANDTGKQIVSQWFDDNKKFFDLIEIGTRKPYYWQNYESPKDTNEIIEIIIPNLASFRRCAYALRWRIWLNAEKGRYTEAFNDAKICYRLGQQLKGDKILIEQVIGIAIEAMSIKAIREILYKYQIDSTTLAMLQRDLEQIIANEKFTISLKAEKMFLYDEIQRCFTEDLFGRGHLYIPRLRKVGGWTGFKGKPDHFLYFLKQAGRILFAHQNKQQTLASANSFYEYLEELSYKSPALMNAERESIGKKIHESFEDNLFMAILTPAIRKVVELSHRIKTNVDATVTVLSILRYKKDLAGYPEDLSELLNKGYLQEIPMDPFSDKPLVYRKTEDGFTFYSVGLNFKDDGGQSGEKNGRIQRWADNGDAVFWPMTKSQ